MNLAFGARASSPAAAAKWRKLGPGNALGKERTCCGRGRPRSELVHGLNTPPKSEVQPLSMNLEFEDAHRPSPSPLNGGTYLASVDEYSVNST